MMRCLVVFARRALILGVLAGTGLFAANTVAMEMPLIAEGCIVCHGPAGKGAGAIPPIVGMERRAFIELWQKLRDGVIPSSIMGRITRGFDAVEVGAIADAFAHSQ